MKLLKLKNIAVFKRYPISTATLAILIAVYQATLLNLGYYKEVFSLLEIDTATDILFLLSMPVVIFCVVFALLNAAFFPRLIKLIGVLFILIGAPLTYFISTFKVVINRDMLQNALETNQAESLSLITSSFVMYVLFLGLLPALFIILLKIKPIGRILPYLIRRVLSILGSILMIGLVAFCLYKNYATFFRNNETLIRYLLPSNYIAALYKQYQYIKISNMPFVTIGEDAHRETNITGNGKKTLMVLLVGETARAQNFSLNGYEKQTTPYLSQEKNGINFSQTASCGTFTAYSVPCMFSSMTRTQYDGITAAHQTNVLDILKTTGVNLLWRDNDDGCKGVCKRIETEDVTSKYKDNQALCQSGHCYDEVLLTDLDKYIDNLDKIDKDTLITLHMIGSHGPTYYQRYPDKFKVFQPSCDTNEINNCDQQALINTYDNTIVYTDYVIKQTIDLLKKYDDKYNLIVMFMSDHGESLGENGIYLHSMPYSVAPKEQTHIPFFVWVSDNFIKQKNIQLSCMQQRGAEQSFSHDNLFHSLLGIFNVNTKLYQPDLDIFSACETGSNINK